MTSSSTDSATGPRAVKPVLQTRLLADLAGLAPAYFGLVMATGIVSIAAHLIGWPQLAGTLFYLNNVMYAVLWLLTLGPGICWPFARSAASPYPCCRRTFMNPGAL